jgi:hypothetical protein
MAWGVPATVATVSLVDAAPSPGVVVAGAGVVATVAADGRRGDVTTELDGSAPLPDEHPVRPTTTTVVKTK